MSSASRCQSDVTLLHKGLGPSLFQSRSRTFADESREQQQKQQVPDTCRSSEKCEVKGRCPFQADPPPAKKFMVQCENRQELNSMFTKRLHNRRRPAPPPSSSVRKTMSRYINNREGASLRQLQEEVEELSMKATCDMQTKERFFKNRPSRFPPPSFMSRWNPRHTDKRYLEKMVYDDPWSLPKEQRIQLQKLTGLRLKTMSTHSKFRIELGINLKFGKDILVPDNKCTCYVQFCDHCEKTHERRCPLHLQALDAPQDDCKTVDYNKSCPFAKNPEDMALEDIKDPAIYVSEVLRRLRVGEIDEPPMPFPRKLLVDPALRKRNLHLNKTRLDDPKSQADLAKKAEKSDAIIQTDKRIAELHEQDLIKDVCSQTTPLRRDDCLLLRQVEGSKLFNSYMTKVDKSIQACRFDIVPFNKQSAPVVTTVAEQIIWQALKETSDETGLVEIRAKKVGQVETLRTLQRAAGFKVEEERFRASAALMEESEMIQELDAEENAEGSIAAILFANNLLRNLSLSACDQLRKDGYLVHKMLLGTYDTTLNKDVPKANHSSKLSRSILNDIMMHSIGDLELGNSRSQLVDEKYLKPSKRSSCSLRELVELHDDNLRNIQKIKSILFSKGWKLGDAVDLSESSRFSATVLLDNIRVSLDANENPGQLVDSAGRSLPIHVKWIPHKWDAENDDGMGKFSGLKKFDIVINEPTSAPQNTEEASVGSLQQNASVLGEVSIDHTRIEIEDDEEDLGTTKDSEAHLVFKSGKSFSEYETD